MRNNNDNNTIPTAGWLEPNRLIALVGTIIIALLLLMMMLFVRLQVPVRAPEPEQSALTMDAIEPDELEYIEPLLLEDAGDLDAAETDPAPKPDGQPDLSPNPSDKKVVNGENPNPNPSQEKLVTTTKPSSKKTTDPTPKEEEDSRIAANMKNQFSPHNGKQGGNTAPSANSGSGGTGTAGATGTMKGGRKLLSCPSPTVTLRQKVVIKVEVYVDAQGRVTEANVLSGSSDATLREKCRQASLKARWTPKDDAPRTRGVITWTLVPKI